MITTTGVYAQSVLTLPDAIEMALSKHFDIQISRIESRIAQRDVSLGNAGFLPTVGLSYLQSESEQNQKLEPFNGSTVEVDNANSKSTNWSVDASWTLFDGFGQFYRFSQFGKLSQLSELQAKQSTELALLDVVATFLEVARQENNLEAATDAVQLSQDRYTRAETKRQLGSATRLESLSAKVDLDVDLSAQMDVQLALNNAKRNLMVLLGNAPSTNFTVDSAISLNETLDITRLKGTYKDENVAINIVRKNDYISRLDAKLIWASLAPRVVVEANYSVAESSNEVGFARTQESDGTTYRLRATWNLFNGFQDLNQLKNTRDGFSVLDLQIQEIELNIERQFENRVDTFETLKRKLELAHSSRETAELNFERASNLYKRGQLTNSEFRDAQVNLIRARNLVSDTLYKAKYAEFQLMQISGVLLKY